MSLSKQHLKYLYELQDEFMCSEYVQDLDVSIKDGKLHLENEWISEIISVSKTLYLSSSAWPDGYFWTLLNTPIQTIIYEFLEVMILEKTKLEFKKLNSYAAIKLEFNSYAAGWSSKFTLHTGFLCKFLWNAENQCVH